MGKEHLATLQSLLERVTAHLPPDIDLEFNSMFGGMGAYARGRIFGILWDGGIAFKLSEDDQAGLLEVEGASRSAPISKKYVVVPEAFLTDGELLRPWAEKAVNYALSLTLPKKKKKS